MSERQTVGTCLAGRETLRRRELVWGWVREPAAPRRFLGCAYIESAVLPLVRVSAADVSDDEA